MQAQGAQESEIYYAMNSKFINMKKINKLTKVKAFKTIYKPVLTYSCESWVLTDRQKT